MVRKIFVPNFSISSKEPSDEDIEKKARQIAINNNLDPDKVITSEPLFYLWEKYKIVAKKMLLVPEEKDTEEYA